jgi:hypothetical protein
VKVSPHTILGGSVSPVVGDFRDIVVLIDGQSRSTGIDRFGRFRLDADGKDGDRERVHVFNGSKLIYDDYQVLPGPVTLHVKRYPPSN